MLLSVNHTTHRAMRALPVFAIGAFAAALGFLATLNALNPDAYIVEQNLARYHATGKIDVYYLTRLSTDGVPALLQGLRTLPEYERAVLRENLGRRRHSLQVRVGHDIGPSFNFAQWQAYELLSEQAASQRQAKSQGR